jgi:hypothetical protein
MRLARHSRRAVTAVECAFIIPVTFTIMMLIVVGSIGIFRYHEVATLAREGARYGSTHGHQWRKDSGLATGASTDWQSDIINNGILPQAVAIDPSALTCTVAWPDVINQPGKPDNWPGSKCTVTVTYQWLPEWGPFPAVTLTSTASMPITN